MELLLGQAEATDVNSSLPECLLLRNEEVRWCRSRMGGDQLSNRNSTDPGVEHKQLMMT